MTKKAWENFMSKVWSKTVNNVLNILSRNGNHLGIGWYSKYF